MAAAPTLMYVRVGHEPYKTVELAPGLCALDVERAVAGAVELPLFTFTLKSDADGRTAAFHAGLTGYWTTITFSAYAAASG